MAGERTAIEIQGFRWLARNVAHLLNEHDVTVDDVLSVVEGEYLAFRAPAGRSSTHVIIGRDARGRSLILYLSETTVRGTWFVHTGWQDAIAHRLLEEEELL